MPKGFRVEGGNGSLSPLLNDQQHNTPDQLVALPVKKVIPPSGTFRTSMNQLTRRFDISGT